jgi:hypothetical protein
MSKINKFHIVSFYTPDYEDIYIRHLYHSLKSTDISYTVECVDMKKEWGKVTCFKPQFILNKLNELDTNLVWLDVDSEILQYPKLFEEIPLEFDIAFHTLDWNKHYNRNSYPNTFQIATGTLFVRNIPIVKKFLQEWIDKGKDAVDDQYAICDTLESFNIKVFNLPVDYCAIVDFQNNMPSYIKNPIIKHYQASRFLRSRRGI